MFGKNMLNKIASGDYGDNKEYLTKPLIKMINNRYISISNLLLKPFTICDNKDDSVAELIHREALYNVILGEYTECIGVSDIDFFENILMNKGFATLNSLPSLRIKFFIDEHFCRKSSFQCRGSRFKRLFRRVWNC